MTRESDSQPGDHGPRPWVGSLAEWMDTKFRIPGTDIRFGLDPIIGVVPGLGDTATLLIGAAMFAEARRLDAPLSLYGRMFGNLALDWAVGLIPGIDLIADTAVKAHSRNAQLLANHAGNRPDGRRAPERSPRQRRPS